MNVQHLESLNDVVEQITGVKQRETIPDEVVRRADEIQLVDLTPVALRNRLARGDVYPAERIDTALANYFRPGNLTALRELALAWLGGPRRRGARRVPQGARDRRAVGDARARPRRAHRLRRRRAPRPPGRTGGAAVEGRPRRRARDPAGRPRCSVRGTARAAARAAGGARRHLPRGRRRRRRRRTPRCGTLAERDADRHGSEPPLALAAAHARIGDRTGHPRVGAGIDVHVVSHPEGRSEDTFVVPRTQRPPTLPRRRVLLGFAIAACWAPAPDVAPRSPPRRRRAAERDAPLPAASSSSSRRSAGSGRRWPRRSAASCSSTGTSSRRSTRSRSAKGRTSSRSRSSSPSR